MMKRFVLTFLIVLAVLSTAAFVLQTELTEETMAAVAFIISIMVGLLGPKPLEYLIDKLGLKGQGAVLFTYAVSFVVSIAALLISKQLFQFEFVWSNALAIAGLMFAGATYAYHRLKDQGRI